MELRKTAPVVSDVETDAVSGAAVSCYGVSRLMIRELSLSGYEGYYVLRDAGFPRNTCPARVIISTDGSKC